ncbi:trans-3-hydroxy-L-proline dehydratase [Planotetraspora silvatica]|uniref:Trans-3-hydroxy-L-proline dehydratase n=1 Tax=Planotetraspora silvatica TaxID=234614 RepID=A0A8J3XRZ1_9ACTN|nr:proline racemase family protein [Planotetraspora silvatica]GII50779.1 trans-3-hydroxy-L-proline dehydratase [Planotetraspora silvatica]
MLEISTVDYHTAGEPFRIVTGGAPDLHGSTVLDRRGNAAAVEPDRVRRLLVHEPRGHADMYGCFVTPPDDDGASFGAVFFHKDGYSTACGHGTIALGVWAVETGRVDAPPDGEVTIWIDVPSGRVAAVVQVSGGKPRSVRFRNIPAFVHARDVTVDTEAGAVPVDIAYGGAFYASVPADRFGATVTPGDLPRLIALSRQIRSALDARQAAEHPADPRLSGIYGVTFYEDLPRPAEGGAHQRSCTVFADGEVDRSPCGSGTSARLALLADEGRLSDGPLVHDSVVGTRFLGRVLGTETTLGRAGYRTEVEGMAFRTGEHLFVLDSDDPLGEGFTLR